jgi:TP901 family phage tail tape measure protein
MAKQLNVNLAFTADTSNAKAQIQSLQSQLTQLASSASSGKFSNLGITEEINNGIKAANELKSILQSSTTSTGSLDLSKFNQALKDSGKKIGDYAKDLTNLGPEGVQAFSQIAKSISTAEVPLKRTSSLLSEFSTTLKNTARWQLSSSILHGFMGSLQSAYGYAQDLNESLTNIRIVTGQSSDEMAAFAEKANKAAQSLSTTTTAYTDAALIFYQQGLDDEEVEDRTNVVIKMAQATGDAATEVSSYMTAIWNNFDDGSTSLEHYSDVITALGAATASSSSEIAEGLSKFSAVAETAGLSYEYATSALATVVAKTRESADTVGNAFKTIFARIQDLELGETLDDGTDLGTYSQALEKVGVDIKDASGELKDMDTVLDELGDKWGTLSNDTQLAVAQAVAGTRQYTQLMALMNNWDYMKENLAVAQDSEGTLTEQAEIYEESWEAASKRVRASLEAIYSDLIDDNAFIAVLNVIDSIVDGIDGLIDAFGGLSSILPAVGGLLLNMFSDDISTGIDNMIYNLKVNSQAGMEEILNQRKEANQALRDMMMDTDKGSNAATADIYIQQADLQDQLIEKTKQLAAAGKEVSENDLKRVQSLMDISSELGDQYLQLVKNKEEQEAIVKSQTRQAQRSILRSQTTTDQETKNKNSKQFESTIKEAKELENEYKVLEGLQSRLGDIDINNPEDLQKAKQYVTDYYEALQSTGNIDTEKLEEINEILKDIKSEDVTNVSQGLSNLDKAVETVGSNALEKFNEAEAILRDSTGDAEQAKQVVDNIVGSADNLGAKIYNANQKFADSRNAAKTAGEAIEGLQGKTASLSEGFVKVAGAGMTYAMALSTISNFGSELFDDETSGIQKVVSGFMALNTAIQAYKSIREAQKTLDEAITALRVKEAGATLTQIAAEKANNLAISASIAFKTAKAAITNTEANFTDAETAAIERNSIAVGSNAAVWYTHPVIAVLAVAILGAVAAISALNSITEKNTEKLKENAEASQKAAEEAQSEADSAKELYSNYKTALQAYNDGTGSKEDLTSATEALLEQYGLENEKLLILTENYKALTKAIEEKREAQVNAAATSAKNALQDEAQLVKDEADNYENKWKDGQLTTGIISQSDLSNNKDIPLYSYSQDGNTKSGNLQALGYSSDTLDPDYNNNFWIQSYLPVEDLSVTDETLSGFLIDNEEQIVELLKNYVTNYNLNAESTVKEVLSDLANKLTSASEEEKEELTNDYGLLIDDFISVDYETKNYGSDILSPILDSIESSYLDFNEDGELINKAQSVGQYLASVEEAKQVIEAAQDQYSDADLELDSQYQDLVAFYDANSDYAENIEKLKEQYGENISEALSLTPENQKEASSIKTLSDYEAFFEDMVKNVSDKIKEDTEDLGIFDFDDESFNEFVKNLVTQLYSADDSLGNFADIYAATLQLIQSSGEDLDDDELVAYQTELTNIYDSLDDAQKEYFFKVDLSLINEDGDLDKQVKDQIDKAQKIADYETILVKTQAVRDNSGDNFEDMGTDQQSYLDWAEKAGITFGEDGFDSLNDFMKQSYEEQQETLQKYLDGLENDLKEKRDVAKDAADEIAGLYEQEASSKESEANAKEDDIKEKTNGKEISDLSEEEISTLGLEEDIKEWQELKDAEQAATDKAKEYNDFSTNADDEQVLQQIIAEKEAAIIRAESLDELKSSWDTIFSTGSEAERTAAQERLKQIIEEETQDLTIQDLQWIKLQDDVNDVVTPAQELSIVLNDIINNGAGIEDLSQAFLDNSISIETLVNGLAELTALDGFDSSKLNELDAVINKMGPELEAAVQGRTLTTEQATQAVANLVEQYGGASSLGIKTFEDLQDAAERLNLSVETQNALFQSLQETLDDDIDTDEFENLVDYIEDADNEIEGLDKDMRSNEKQVKKVAQSLLRYNSALEDVADNYDDWMAALEAGDLQEQAEVGKELANTYGDLLDIDASSLSDGFLTSTENLKLLQEAANGSEEAYEELQEAAAKDILVQCGIDTSKYDEDLNYIESTAATANEELLDDLEVGASLDNEDFLNGLTQMINAAGMTAEQATDYLSSMGVDAQVEQVETTTEDAKEVLGWNSTLNPVTEKGSATVPVGTGDGMSTKDIDLPVTVYEETAEPVTQTGTEENTTSAFALKVTSANKSSGGNFKYNNSSAGGGSRRSSGSGTRSRGRSGSGSRSTTRRNSAEKKDPSAERYHKISKTLSTLEKQYDAISKAKDRAFGKSKLKNLQDELKTQQAIVKTQEEYLKQAKEYLKSDKKKLDSTGTTTVNVDGKDYKVNASAEGYLGMKVQYDENNNISNYDELTAANDKKLEEARKKYIQSNTDDDAAKLAWEKAQAQYEAFQKFLSQYEETVEKVQDEEQNLTDAANDAYDTIIEITNTKLELKIEVNEEELKLLDYYLNNLGDDIYDIAEAITILSKEADNSLSTISAVTQNMEDTYTDALTKAGVTDVDKKVQKLMNGETLSDEDMKSLQENMTDEQKEQLKSDTAKLLEENNNLLQIQAQIYEDIGKAFDDNDEKLDKQINKLQRLGKVTETYKNLVDIYGQKNLGVSNDTMNKLYETQRLQAKNEYDALVSKKEMQESEIKKMEEAKQQLIDLGFNENSTNVKELQEQIDAANDALETTEDNIEDAKSSIAELTVAQFVQEITSAVDAFKEACAGLAGNIDELQASFERSQDIEEEYIPEYQKVYELTKLTRQVNNSIDNTSNIKGKKELNKLLEEINAKQEKGVEMSEYELEYLQKKYELKVAELALSEAQNAKSQVRLTQDSEGNYGYVYTADDSQVEDAEQNYEDKLYEMQQLNADYINTLQEQMIQLRQEEADALASLADEYQGDVEGFNKAAAELQAYYAEKNRYTSEQMGIVIENNKELYEDDVATYAKATDNKALADEDYIEDFSQTQLSIATGYGRLEEYQDAYVQSAKDMYLTAADASAEYASNIQDDLTQMGYDADAFDKQMSEDLDEVQEESEALKDSISETAEQAEEDFQGIIDKVETFQSNYSKTIDEILAKNEALVASFNALLASWNQVETKNDTVQTDTGGTGGETGGTGGETGGTGDDGKGNSDDEKGKKLTNAIKKGIAAAIWMDGGDASGWGNDPYRAKRFKEKFGSKGSEIQSYINAHAANGDIYKEWASKRSKLKQYYYSKFDTGGYTGEWGSNEGKFAMLHQKEIVLNADDTENFLNAINMVREISNLIDLNAMSASGGLGQILAASIGKTSDQTLEQEVHITAEFPNATNKDEILEAFDNVINLASQYANRK